MTRGERVSLSVLAVTALFAILPIASSSAPGTLTLAARSTLVVGLGSAALGLAAGASLAAAGLALGARGRVLVTRVAESLGALPTVLVVPLLAAAPLGPTAARVALALALARAAEAMHLVLLEARGISADGWVEASIALGAAPTRLLGAHLAPRVAPLLAASALAGSATAVPLELAVAFLGLAPPSRLGQVLAIALTDGHALPLVVAALPALAVSAALGWLARASRGSRPGVAW